MAVHGDEGDDQHGLKVHEVHDMQPGMPSKPPGDALHGVLPLQPSLPQKPPASALQDQPLLFSIVAGSQHSAQSRGIVVLSPADGQNSRQTSDTPVICGQVDLSSKLCGTVGPDAIGKGAAALLKDTKTLDTADPSKPSDTVPGPMTGTHDHAAGEPDVIDLISPGGKQQEEDQIQLGQPEQLSQLPKFQLDQDRPPYSFAADAMLCKAAQAALYCSQLHTGPATLPTDPERRHVDALCPAGALPEEHDRQKANIVAHASARTEATTDTDASCSRRTAADAHTVANTEKLEASSQHVGLEYKQSVSMHSRIKALLSKEEVADSPALGSKQDASHDDRAPILTQVEVIDAQTVDEEAPQVDALRCAST